MSGKLMSGWSSVLMTGMRAARIAHRNLNNCTGLHTGTWKVNRIAKRQGYINRGTCS